MLYYSKTCVIYDPTKRINVTGIFFGKNIIMKVMQDFFVLVYVHAEYRHINAFGSYKESTKEKFWIDIAHIIYNLI